MGAVTDNNRSALGPPFVTEKYRAPTLATGGVGGDHGCGVVVEGVKRALKVHNLEPVAVVSTEQRLQKMRDRMIVEIAGDVTDAQPPRPRRRSDLQRRIALRDGRAVTASDGRSGVGWIEWNRNQR